MTGKSEILFGNFRASSSSHAYAYAQSLDGGGSLVTKSSLTLAIPWTVACQASLSIGFSRQEYWSGLPFPSPGILPTQGSNLDLLHCRQMIYQLSYEGSQACSTLCNPLDCCLPGSSVHRFSQQEYWSGLSFPLPALTSYLHKRKVEY